MITNMDGYRYLLELPVNKSGRDFIRGDIHGMYNLLMESLDVVDFNYECDRLISVGDVIDRGEESYKCLDLFYSPWFYAVRGNHEQMMIDGLLKAPQDVMSWIYNGGGWFLEENLDEVISIAEDLDKRLPYGIVVNTKNGKRLGVIHADVVDNSFSGTFTNPTEGDLIATLWSRTRINKKDFKLYEV